MNILKQATRGAELLDEKKPDWASEININELDISTFDNCILGQCFGTYSNGLRFLKLGFDDATQYGFGFSIKAKTLAGNRRYFCKLKNTWIPLIQERQAA